MDSVSTTKLETLGPVDCTDDEYFLCSCADIDEYDDLIGDCGYSEYGWYDGPFELGAEMQYSTVPAPVDLLLLTHQASDIATMKENYIPFYTPLVPVDSPILFDAYAQILDDNNLDSKSNSLFELVRMIVKERDRRNTYFVGGEFSGEECKLADIIIEVEGYSVVMHLGRRFYVSNDINVQHFKDEVDNVAEQYGSDSLVRATSTQSSFSLPMTRWTSVRGIPTFR